MFKKNMKKIICGVLATASVAACVGTFTACETSHPEATVTIEFNENTYTLNYKLYRKIAPSTVKHFIWLAENDYYTDVCIHDYDAGAKRMYTGAYKVDADNELTELDYFKLVSEHKNVGNFPHSVWDLTNTPTYTLYGEFEDNAFKVTNGALKETYGSLTMYYHDKNIEDEVYVKKASNGDKTERAYKYNSATSMFYISTVSSATKNGNYCTFATLEDDSDLKALEDAIADYIEDNYEDEDGFVTSKTVAVDKYDPYVSSLGKTETFELPNEPIVIKSVKITKY